MGRAPRGAPFIGAAIVLLSVAFFLAELGAQPLSISATDRDRHGEVALDRGWQARLPNDPSSTWRPAHPRLMPDQIPEGFDGEAWFRLELLPEGPGWEEAGLLAVHLGPIEVYLDGRRVYALDGTDGPEAALFPRARPLPLVSGRAHVLEVHLRSPIWKTARRLGLMGGFIMGLDRMPEAQKRLEDARVLETAQHAALIAVTATFTMLHLLFFLFHRERRHNLYFAGFNFGATVLNLISMFNPAYERAAVLPYVHAVAAFCSVTIGTTLFLLIHDLFEIRMPRRTAVFAVLGLAYIPLSTSLHFACVFVPIAVGVVELLRVVGLGLVRRREGTWILAAGVLCLAAGVAVQGFADIESNIGAEQHFGAGYGIMAFLLAMSVRVAREIARTNRRAQEAELEGVRLEEENKRKAQALEEAARLEVAHRELASKHVELGEKHAELKQTQARLVQSEKMASLGMLVAGIAHEINSPLGAMLSSTSSLRAASRKLNEALPEATKSTPTVERSLAAIERTAEVLGTGGERIDGIIKRLRSFARLDEAELKRVDVHVGLDDALAIVSHQMPANVQIVKVYGDVPPIACYPGQLNQVFLNLLMNASQAIGEARAGRIEIRTRPAELGLEILISDDGCGMTEDVKARIFDPGFTTRARGVGTGLGLSICYQVVQAHRGRIEVQSAPDAGTTVTVSLPLNLERHLGAAGS